MRLSGAMAQRLGARRSVALEHGATVDDLVAALARDAGFDPPELPALHPSPPPPAAKTVTASTAAATANSTSRCTASRSMPLVTTPQPPPTSPASKPKE